MEDLAIIELYFARSEAAISETDKKYESSAFRSPTTYSTTVWTRKKASMIHSCKPGILSGKTEQLVRVFGKDRPQYLS